MEGHPIKKEFQTSSFRIQQRGTFQESKSTKVQNREEVKPGIWVIYFSVGLILEDIIIIL